MSDQYVHSRGLICSTYLRNHLTSRSMILMNFDEGTDFVLTTVLTALEMIVCLCFDAEIGVDYVLQDIPQFL